MMVGIIVLAVLVVILLIGLIVVVVELNREKGDARKETSLPSPPNDAALTELETTKKRLIAQLEDEINRLIEDRDDAIAQYEIKQHRLDEMETSLKQMEGSLNDTVAALQTAQTKYAALQTNYKALEDGWYKLDAASQEAHQQLDWLKERLRNGLELEKLQASGATNGWSINLSAKEEKLIALLKEIGNNYAELRSDLAAIEWKKIWLPWLQKVVAQGQLNGVSGIYKISLKENPQICYIGQAVDIKERWYQHVKKMIGVMAIGDELLYDKGDRRPEDCIWSVVEIVDKSAGKDALNEAERYWIESLGCKEIGLNRK